MSTGDSIDQQRKLGQKLAHAAEEVKLKHSPPLASKHPRATTAKPNGTPLVPKNDPPWVNQKVTQQRAVIPGKPSPPQLPGGMKPSVPLLPKGNLKAGKDGGESLKFSEADKANARNILDGVLKGKTPASSRPKGSPGGVSKKPLPPLKPVLATRDQRDDRTKSVDLSGKDHQGQLDSALNHGSLSQARSKVTQSLLLDGSDSGANNEDSHERSDKLPKADQSNDRTKGSNDVSWRQVGNKSQRKEVASLADSPSREGVPRKPFPPPKKPAHLISPERKSAVSPDRKSAHLMSPKRNSTHLTSPERNSLKARSTSDLMDSGKFVPAATSPKRLAHTPQPVRGAGKTMPFETKFNTDGPKPPISGVKPAVSGTKPVLHGAKPKPATPAKLTSGAETKPKPLGVPVGTKPKPAGAKPKLPGDKPTKPSTTKPERQAPQPAPKVIDSPKQKPLPPSKPHPISGLRDSHFGQPVSEECLADDDPRSSSEADVSRTELDKTLTLPEEQGAGQEVELENTVVVEERSEDWVVVAASPTDSKSPSASVKTTHPKKPLPMMPRTPNSAIRQVEGNGHSPPFANKPLPSPPSRRGKDAPKPLQTLGAGSESKVESSSNVPRYPPPLEAEPPRSPGFHGEAGTKPPTPSGSPLIRILPSSFSKAMPSECAYLGVKGGGLGVGGGQRGMKM